jgi:hypothetical protein
MNGSTKDYKFGRKNNWRRWNWNQILHRTNGREKTEIVLYLAGPDDLDRPIAIGKGVPSRNLIAVDRVFDNVAGVRARKGYAIQADILDLLRAWPPDVQVCAVVLDLCSGLWDRERLSRLCALFMLHPSLQNAVLGCNLQRGRDAAANDVIQTLAGRPEIRWPEIQKQFGTVVGPKHRGHVFALYRAMEAAFVMSAGCEQVYPNLKLFEPAFFSYRSGVLVFDSVVMDAFTSHWESDDSGRGYWKGLSKIYPKNLDVGRNIAATLATRTRQSGGA